MSAAPAAETIGILVANRGEIAVRIIRSAQSLGLRTVAVQSTTEASLGRSAGLHTALADEIVTLPGAGAAAYLDPEAIVSAATSTNCSLVHPGYGFLSESPRLARACNEAGVAWIGPDADALALFGDKNATRLRAEDLGIPTPPATGLLSLDDSEGAGAAAQVRDLLESNPSGIVVKALAGGGGRGIRIITSPAEIESALRACSAEAAAGFGDDRIFAEALMAEARHIEVQVIGTAEGVTVLGDRDCSIQRRRQKLVEIAPAPDLPAELRARLHADAARLAASANYRSLGTVEFLVTDTDWALLEVNPRLQVEHTVTEAVTGLDLVAAQIAIASGRNPVGLDEFDTRGHAIELRVCAETLMDSGDPAPSIGEIEQIAWPTGPGVRVDTWARAGARVIGAFDPLLAKIIVSAPSLEAAASAAGRALEEAQVTGIETNLGLLRALTEVLNLGDATTSAFDEHAETILRRAVELEQVSNADRSEAEHVNCAPDSAPTGSLGEMKVGPDESPVRATMSGTVVSLGEDPQEYVLIEAMKMHHPVPGPPADAVRHLVAAGDQVTVGQPIAVLTGAQESVAETGVRHEPHPGVAEVRERHARLEDSAREEAVAKIHARNRRTARENIADLVDEGSFVEFGPLVIAAQTRRRSVDDLIAKTSGDGLIGGRAEVDGREVVVISYDYSVLAGTQGMRNHAKTDRLIQLAESKRVPIVLFAEGGGGRPGDTDSAPGTGLDVPTFASLAGLRGQVPLIAIVSGRCFAGNAALAGVCDLVIATPDANIGMGGPAMVEGGGLGRFRPEDIGPVADHTANGVVDVLAADEAEAVSLAKEMVGILSGAGDESAAGSVEGTVADERARSIVPADRLRTFAIRDAIDAIADESTFIEVRRDFAPGAVTGFIRIDGRPLAVIANDNHHLGGAIDVDAARSITQHLRLADSHGVSVLSLIDTPGFMVGPDAEKEPGVRAFGDLFVAGAALTVPVGAVIIRKGYGLGAMAMAAGGFDSTTFTIAWPSGEIGPMGLEGSVRLGYTKELAAIDDPDERKRRETELIEAEYEQGKAMSAAMIFDIDDVIDPPLTREWARMLRTP
jgi:acetyl/propionyl-CoA carboxylase alpha subunit/acetyl-CoA carboxylase carboxyltransferase component